MGNYGQDPHLALIPPTIYMKEPCFAYLMRVAGCLPVTEPLVRGVTHTEEGWRANTHCLLSAVPGI